MVWRSDLRRCRTRTDLVSGSPGLSSAGSLETALRRSPRQVPRATAPAATEAGARRIVWPGPARYDRRVAYDEDLAARIRDLIGPDPDLTEKKMFGGLAFLIRGHMAISASGQGGVLVRVDPADSGALIATANATLAVMGGRTMQGWLRVSSEDLETDEELTEWVDRAVAYARSLPPKR